ncbi:MAG: hypothetical protein A2V65_03265 [Deltaproteobacteria bacterium RBG_13_49_15]|nr:MAG: hypothetical protein A2V65_03265 [Deltaproteobacteria bacterium RBG_13_49_15]
MTIQASENHPFLTDISTLAILFTLYSCFRDSIPKQLGLPRRLNANFEKEVMVNQKPSVFPAL